MGFVVDKNQSGEVYQISAKQTFWSHINQSEGAMTNFLTVMFINIFASIFIYSLIINYIEGTQGGILNLIVTDYLDINITLISTILFLFEYVVYYTILALIIAKLWPTTSFNLKIKPENKQLYVNNEWKSTEEGQKLFLTREFGSSKSMYQKKKIYLSRWSLQFNSDIILSYKASNIEYTNQSLYNQAWINQMAEFAVEHLNMTFVDKTGIEDIEKTIKNLDTPLANQLQKKGEEVPELVNSNIVSKGWYLDSSQLFIPIIGGLYIIMSLLYRRVIEGSTNLSNTELLLAFIPGLFVIIGWLLISLRKHVIKVEKNQISYVVRGIGFNLDKDTMKLDKLEHILIIKPSIGYGVELLSDKERLPIIGGIDTLEDAKSLKIRFENLLRAHEVEVEE